MTNDNIQGLRDKVEDTHEIHALIRYIDWGAKKLQLHRRLLAFFWHVLTA